MEEPSTGLSRIKRKLKAKRDPVAPPDVLAAAYKGSQQTGRYIIAGDDIHRPPGPEQNFLVMSYVTPDGSTRVRSTKNLLQKFSGTFRLESDAREHAKVIRDENPIFDVQVSFFTYIYCLHGSKRWSIYTNGVACRCRTRRGRSCAASIPTPY